MTPVLSWCGRFLHWKEFLEVLNNEIANDSGHSDAEATVNSILQGTEFYLVEMVIRGHAGSHVVEIYLDSEEGADIDEIARVSRTIATEFEDRELFPVGYKLTVSTPGLDRPLTDRRQFKRHEGKSLKVVYTEGDTRKTVKGVLVSSDARKITLEKTNKEIIDVDFSDIAKATIELPW